MTGSSATIHRILAALAILLAASLACSIGRDATPAPDAPIITLSSPQPGQTAPVGEPILVNSTSVDADGIQRVELWVDNTLLRVDSNPDASSPYIVSQPWQSEVPGRHVILVKAFDAEGAEGRSEPVVITLKAEAEITPASTPAAQASPSPEEGPPPTKTSLPLTPSPTPASEPTSTPFVVCTPPACSENEVYHCEGECPGGCGTQCATPTPTPPSFQPTGVEPHDVFKPVWEQPTVKDYLGYPTDEASDDRHYARQYFERGYLYWWDRPDEPDLIWAVEMPDPAAGQGFRWRGPYEDTWGEGDPYSCDKARANPNGPIRGFGKLWCDHPEIAEAIGAARDPEEGTGESANYGVVQFFQGGAMLYSPLDREVWVLFKGGTWQRHPR